MSQARKPASTTPYSHGIVSFYVDISKFSSRASFDVFRKKTTGL